MFLRYNFSGGCSFDLDGTVMTFLYLEEFDRPQPDHGEYKRPGNSGAYQARMPVPAERLKKRGSIHLDNGKDGEENMTLEELMQELGARLGLGKVELDEDGGAQIVVEDDLEVDVAHAEEGPGFTLSAVVGPLHVNDREAKLTELLAANLLGRSTGGAALGLDDALDEIVLSRIVTQDDLPFEVFERELVTFIEVLRVWRDRHRQELIGKGDLETQAVAADGSAFISGAGIIRV